MCEIYQKLLETSRSLTITLCVYRGCCVNLKAFIQISTSDMANISTLHGAALTFETIIVHQWGLFLKVYWVLLWARNIWVQLQCLEECCVDEAQYAPQQMRFLSLQILPSYVVQ
jgi:hypothetical protein